MNEIIRLGPLTLRANLGAGDGVPLLLFNAWRAPMETLDPLVQALGERPVLRLDLPGTGESPPLARVLRPAQIADIAADAAGYYGIRQMDVAGYAFGGTAAQEMARRHGGRVRRLILMATSPGHLMFPPAISSLAPLLRATLLGRAHSTGQWLDPDFLKTATPGVFGGAACSQPQKALQQFSAASSGLNRAELLRQATGLAGWSSLPWLGDLHQPALILAGRADGLVHPFNALMLKRWLRDAELQWMPGGHLFPLLDCPARTAAAINHFSGHHGNVVNMNACRGKARAMH